MKAEDLKAGTGDGVEVLLKEALKTALFDSHVKSSRCVLIVIDAYLGGEYPEISELLRELSRKTFKEDYY